MALIKYELLVGTTAADLQNRVRAKQATGSVIVYGMFQRGGYYCQAVGTGTLDVGTLSQYQIISSPNIETFSAMVTSMLPGTQPLGTPVVYNSALFQVMGVIQPYNMTGQNGANGKTPEIQVADGWVQWKYTTDTAWQNLISLSTLTGASADMRVSNSAIQWKRSTETDWTTLVGLDQLTGPAGPGNSLSIGSVTTLAAGAQATASITGTSPNQVLNIGIPAGPAGNDGSTPLISIGTVTTLPSGSEATATIVNGKINLGIPRGNNGRDGNNALPNTLTIGTVSTSAPGGSASATITGTAPNQTLNLTIPGATKGDAGPANSIGIGTVTTSAPGTQAAATLTGSSPNQVLNLTLPRGNNGNDGVPSTLSVGTVTTLAPGSSATATITGTSPNQVLNLSLPAGANGASPVLSIGTITTLAAGASASATITGTSPNFVLNLGIPRGNTGAAATNESISGTVVTAGTAVAVTFGKAYTAVPSVVPVTTGTADKVFLPIISNVTTTGCSVLVIQTRGTLLLSGGPVENAAAGSAFRIVVIGS